MLHLLDDLKSHEIKIEICVHIVGLWLTSGRIFIWLTQKNTEIRVLGEGVVIMMNPAEILSATIHHGTEKVKRPMLEKVVLGFIGGAMISMGYLLYIRVVSSVVGELGSLASFIGAAVFPIGLIVILMGAES